jgi:hypothetical protein
VLPNSGGVLQQNEDDIKRMLVVYDHVDSWRKLEMDRLTSGGGS